MIRIKNIELREIANDIFVFQLFTPMQCERLLKRIERYRAALPPAPPNSMNRYGAIMGGELRPLLARLAATWVQPVAKARSAQRLRKHPYAFTIDYTPRTQRALASHVDQSDWTLNVCLGRTFIGGDLRFVDAEVRIAQAPGQAVIHPGAAAHRACGVTRGERTNLVLWCAAKRSR